MLWITLAVTHHFLEDEQKMGLSPAICLLGLLFVCFPAVQAATSTALPQRPFLDSFCALDNPRKSPGWDACCVNKPSVSGKSAASDWTTWPTSKGKTRVEERLDLWLICSIRRNNDSRRYNNGLICSYLRIRKGSMTTNRHFLKLKSGERSTPTRESGIVLNRCPKRRLLRGPVHPSIQTGKVSERVLLKQRDLRRGEE